ncbi:hypothetical protein [Saccharopolyspora hattusasensis]
MEIAVPGEKSVTGLVRGGPDVVVERPQWTLLGSGLCGFGS